MENILVFAVGDGAFGLPTANVEEVLRMAWVTPIPESPRDVCGLLNVRGRLVVVVDPAARLGQPSVVARPDDFLVVASEPPVACKVSAVDNIVSATVEPVDPFASPPPFVRGYIRHKGVPIAVLELATLLLPETATRVVEWTASPQRPRSP